MGRRITMHNGRMRKQNGIKEAYNANHNSLGREDFKGGEHIEKSLSSQNIYWSWNGNINSFRDSELKFYNKYFKETLEIQNKKHEKSRHLERIKTMEQFYESPNFCPEETIMQLGRAGDCYDIKTLEEFYNKFIAWHNKEYPQAIILDMAIHQDEFHPDENKELKPLAPHLHMRKVWVAHDEQGNFMVSQRKSLQEMGVELPDPTKQENRYNNLKMTYSETCRNKALEIAKEMGLEIEEEPKEPSKVGLSHEQYKMQLIKEKANKLEQENINLKKEMKSLLQKIDELSTQEITLDSEIFKKSKELKNLDTEYDTKNKSLKEIFDKSVLELNKYYEDKKELLNNKYNEFESTLQSNAATLTMCHELVEKYPNSEERQQLDEWLYDIFKIR